MPCAQGSTSDECAQLHSKRAQASDATIRMMALCYRTSARIPCADPILARSRRRAARSAVTSVLLFTLEERVGFEPTERSSRSAVFKTAAFNRSATSPRLGFMRFFTAQALRVAWLGAISVQSLRETRLARLISRESRGSPEPAEGYRSRPRPVCRSQRRASPGRVSAVSRRLHPGHLPHTLVGYVGAEIEEKVAGDVGAGLLLGLRFTELG